MLFQVSLTKEYDDLVTILKYDAKFKVAAGNSRPKVMICWGSDGKQYKQLVKVRERLTEFS